MHGPDMTKATGREGLRRRLERRNAAEQAMHCDGLGGDPIAFRYFMLQADAIDAAREHFVERGYEHFAAIAAGEDLVRRACGAGWAGEYLEHDGVIARYTATGYSVGAAPVDEDCPRCGKRADICLGRTHEGATQWRCEDCGLPFLVFPDVE